MFVILILLIASFVAQYVEEDLKRMIAAGLDDIADDQFKKA